VDQVVGAELEQERLQALAWKRRPGAFAEGAQLLALLGLQLQAPGRELAFEPGTEAGDRGEGRKGAQARKLELEEVEHLLDQEAAEADPGQARLDARDRVEDRAVRLGRVGERGVRVED